MRRALARNNAICRNGAFCWRPLPTATFDSDCLKTVCLAGTSGKGGPRSSMLVFEGQVRCSNKLQNCVVHPKPQSCTFLLKNRAPQNGLQAASSKRRVRALPCLRLRCGPGAPKLHKRMIRIFEKSAIMSLEATTVQAQIP